MKKLLPIILSLFFIRGFAQEICDNGIDDDLNGLVDLNDTACTCNGFGSGLSGLSYLPNPSFEDLTCCPSGYSQINCVNDWIQASDPTTDYWNTCGSAGSGYDGLASLPIPDGDGFAGIINMSGWQEYLGACLDEPLLADTSYVFSFYLGHTSNSPIIELAIFGTTNCSHLPFSGSDCPVGQDDWELMGSTIVGGDSAWVQYSMAFTPNQNTEAIAIGAVCSSGGARTYYYLDDLEIRLVGPDYPLTITAIGQYCNDDLILESSIDTSGGSWQWYFEGIALVGETSDSLNISANGYSVGTYSSVYTIGGNCQTAEYTIAPTDTVIAGLLTDSVCLGEFSHFIDLSTTSADSLGSWNWDFGDGSTSDIQNPVHVYPAYGTYEVILTPTSPTGCTDTAIAYAVVYPLPEADFGWTADCSSYEVEFTDLSTISGGASSSEWSWSFGNGDSSTVTNPTHQFDSLGVYLVYLQVTSSDGCTDQVAHQVPIQLGPEANFSFSEVCLGYSSNFHDLSLPFGGPLVLWDWDFGDGGYSSAEDPVHTYSTPDSFLVTLTVTDINGCMDTLSQWVDVFVCNANSIDDQTDQAQVEFYPNPSSSVTTIESSEAMEQIMLFDNSGKLILHVSGISSNREELNLSSIAAGTYLARVLFGNSATSEFRISVVK